MIGRLIDRASKRSIAHLINLYHHKLVVVNCFSVFKLDVMFVHDHFDKCLALILNEYLFYKFIQQVNKPPTSWSGY